MGGRLDPHEPPRHHPGHVCCTAENASKQASGKEVQPAKSAYHIAIPADLFTTVLGMQGPQPQAKHPLCLLGTPFV